MVFSIVSLAALAVITIGLSRLKPAAPSVEIATILRDTVKRGPFVRDVHGNGILVPEEIVWITATTPGRVERILLLPGVEVQPDTVLVELSNPDLMQQAFEAEAAVESARAELEKLRVQLESEHLSLESTLASIKSELTMSRIEAESDGRLLKEGLIPDLAAKRSRAKADEWGARLQLEERRLEISGKSAQAQLRVQEAEIEKLRKQHQLRRHQVEALRVKAGLEGVLARIGDDRPLQIGQQLVTGASLARVANPSKLKAEIRIPETQARDVQHGQSVVVDTRNGVVAGHVVRIDPASVNGTVTVDVKLDGALPRGARPDLSVDATITLEKLDSLLFVGRPVNSQAEGRIGLFKVDGNRREARRVPVRLGRVSVRDIEIVEGLQEGDQVIISDMSPWDSLDRLRLR